MKANSATIKENYAIDKLRNELHDATEKAITLRQENDEKEMFISRNLAENENLRQSIEILEKRLKTRSKTGGIIDKPPSGLQLVAI